ncbi:MAG: hypothetical protein IJI14_08340 [Anaerolineaceae bacterium]|nr:hypothetical protein [Anaerolineaceae bacterium]
MKKLLGNIFEKISLGAAFLGIKIGESLYGPDFLEPQDDMYDFLGGSCKP